MGPLDCGQATPTGKPFKSYQNAQVQGTVKTDSPTLCKSAREWRDSTHPVYQEG
jgi:hypothetical protein